MSVLDDDGVVTAVRVAWDESYPGASDAHEEGGFILRNLDGSLEVERWPKGAQNQIVVPAHPACMRGTLVILATFHTHPNPGPDFLQEPSLTDIRAVRNDPDLKHAEFEGEYIISAELVYRILSDGRVKVIGETRAVLRIS